MWPYKERFGLSTAAGRYFLALSLGTKNTWKMSFKFNKSKCRVMHMTHKKTCACLPTCMREVPLVPTNTRKHLGVQLTSNLDGGTHVQPFQPRLIGLSDYSNAISNTFLLASKRQQSKPWCDPRWITCSSVWNPNEKVDVATLEKVQCRAARYVKNDYRRNPVSLK